MAEKTKTKNSLNLEISGMTASLDSLRFKLGNAKNAAESARAAETAARAAKKRLDGEKTRLDDEVKTLTAKNERARKNAQEIASQARKSRDELSSILTELTKQQKELARINSAIKDANTQFGNTAARQTPTPNSSQAPVQGTNQ